MKAVVLINFGGPRQRDEIRPFLADIFKDVLPRLMKPFASLLARLREPYAQKMYTAIGGVSPVVSWTKVQAQALENKGKYKVYAGMMYGHPSISDAINEAKTDGAEKIILLPLFPYQSRYISIDISNLRTYALTHLRTSDWHAHPLYISVMVNIIRTALTNWKGVSPPHINLIFSAHAIPLSAIKTGDPYLRQVNESVSKIMEHFTGYNHHIAFQSASGPIRWIKPFTKEIIEQIRQHASTPARQHTLIIPLGFACENIETLYEIDHIYIPYAKRLGLGNIARAPAINDNPQFIDLLAELVLEE